MAANFAGQLAGTSATLNGGSAGVKSCLALFNTDTVSDTVTLQITPAGGTIQTLMVIVLAAGEHALVENIPLNTGDVLSGYATNANKVNYVVYPYSMPGPFAVQILDLQGLPKNKQIQGIGQALNNLTATTDPGVGNDNTQGYAAGSFWINTTLQRVWMCMSASTGAAVWLLDGVVPGTGVEPSSMLTQAGNALVANPLTPFAQFGEEGNLYRNVGAPIASNGADTTDDILDGFVLPANAFDQAKRGLAITACGNFAATANNKRVRIWANPTMAGQTVTNGVISGGTVTGVGSGVLLYDSGMQTGNNIGWQVTANLYKYGAGGSNTQNYNAEPVFGTTHGGVTKTGQATLVENAAINIVITGSSMTTGAAGDVNAELTAMNWMN